MKNWLLIFFLSFSLLPSQAQWFIRNLYARFQRVELQKINRYGWHADLPLNCHPSHDARKLWNMAEKYLIETSVPSFQKEQWEKEITLFRSCVKLDSNFCDAYYRLAQCLVETGRWMDVIELLQKAQKRFPQNALSYLGLGQAYLGMEYPDKALPYFENVISLLPKSPEGYLGASCALYDLNQKEKALQKIQEAYDVGVTGIAPIRLFEGIMLFELSRYQQAFDVLSAITLENKSYYFKPALEIVGPANYYLGLCLIAGGEEFFDRADKHVRAAKSQGIQIDSAVGRMLRIYIEPENIKEQLLECYPRNLLSNHVQNIQNGQDYCLQRDALNDKSTVESYMRTAQCFNKRRDYQQALTALKRGREKYSKDVRLKLLLERQFVLTDSIDAALKLCLVDLNEKTKNINPVSRAALMYAVSGKYQSGLIFLKKVELRFDKRLDGIPWQVKMYVGELLYLKGAYEEAFKYLQNAQRFTSGDVHLSYYAGLCSGKLEYNTEAKSYFYDAMKLGAIIPPSVRNKFQLVVR